MSNRLVILGSKGGPAIRPGGPSPSSSLLDIAGRRIVVDCGLGVTRGLVDAGVDQAGLERLLSPIGLDIGARTPEETAVSICAEIIALRTGRAAPSLRDGDGPIHR